MTGCIASRSFLISAHAELFLFLFLYCRVRCFLIAAVTTADAARAAQRVLRTDAIPASPSAGAALHAAAQLIANGKSRSALAVFSARQNIL